MTDFSDMLIIIGDFQIDIDHPSNFLVTKSFNLVQHVSGPRRNHEHTLDLVVTLGFQLSSLICLKQSQIDINDSVNWHIELWSSTVDTVAPNKFRAPVVSVSPWIDDCIQHHRRGCRKTEQ